MDMHVVCGKATLAYTKRKIWQPCRQVDVIGLLVRLNVERAIRKIALCRGRLCCCAFRERTVGLVYRKFGDLARPNVKDACCLLGAISRC